MDQILSAARDNEATKATQNKLTIADKFWELSDVPAAWAGHGTRCSGIARPVWTGRASWNSDADKLVGR